MKIFLILILLAILSSSCKVKHCEKIQQRLEIAQDSLVGIGLLEIALDKPIEVYQSINDKKYFDKLVFKPIETGQSKGSYEIKSKYLNSIFNPYKFDKGYSDEKRNDPDPYFIFNPRVIFRVLKIDENYLTVILNENTKKIIVLKLERLTMNYNLYNKDYQHENWTFNLNKINLFETWEHYLPRCQYIMTKTRDIYDKPYGKISFEKKTSSRSSKMICKVIEVKGEWMRVNTDGAMYREDIVGDRWIKWRTADEIIIDIFEQTYL